MGEDAVELVLHPAKVYPLLDGVLVDRVRSVPLVLVCATGAPLPPFASKLTVYVGVVSTHTAYNVAGSSNQYWPPGVYLTACIGPGVVAQPVNL